ncbi:MAG: transposase [Treponema sp.]
MTGKEGRLRQLTSLFYERILNAEMDDLGYKKHDSAGEHSGNSRDGYSEKPVILDTTSTAKIHVPRNRNTTHPSCRLFLRRLKRCLSLTYGGSN